MILIFSGYWPQEQPDPAVTLHDTLTDKLGMKPADYMAMSLLRAIVHYFDLTPKE